MENNEFDFLEPTSSTIIRKIMEAPAGIPCGLPGAKGELKLRTGLTMIAANTGHGKTSALNLCTRKVADYLIAQKKDGAVLYITMEEPAEDIAADFAIAGSSPNTRKAISKEILNNDDELSPKEALALALRNDADGSVQRDVESFLIKYIESERVKICYTSAGTEDIASLIRKQIEENKIEVIVLDYFQQLFSKTGGDRVTELKRITSIFRQLLTENKKPFLSAVQFNRTVEIPNEMKASALGESGDLERVSNTVIGLFNLSKVETSGLSAAKQKVFAATMGGVPTSMRNEAATKDCDIVLVKGLKGRNGRSGWTKYGLFDGSTKSFFFPLKRH